MGPGDPFAPSHRPPAPDTGSLTRSQGAVGRRSVWSTAGVGAGFGLVWIAWGFPAAVLVALCAGVGAALGWLLDAVRHGRLDVRGAVRTLVRPLREGP